MTVALQQAAMPGTLRPAHSPMIWRTVPTLACQRPKPGPPIEAAGPGLRLPPRWPPRSPFASRPRHCDPAPVLCALPVLSPRQSRRPLETVMNQALTPFDTDPLETREWRESLEAVMQAGGRPRAHYLIDQLSELDAQRH